MEKSNIGQLAEAARELVRRWQMAKLLRTGRELYDAMQSICEKTLEMTDRQLADSHPLCKVDPDQERANARILQDDLNHQGREAFAAEFAQRKSKTLTR